MLTGEKCFILQQDINFRQTVIAKDLLNSQTLFCNHMRRMFIANLHDNNDSRIGKFAGNRSSRYDVIKLDSHNKWLLH